MRGGILFEKRTWIGLGAAVGIMGVVFMVGSLLMVHGVLPMEAASPLVWSSYGLAALIGGRVAAAGKRERLCACVPGLIIYVLAWMLALCCEGRIDFFANGIGITIMVILGILTAVLWSRPRKKSRHSKRGKRSVTRTIHR